MEITNNNINYIIIATFTSYIMKRQINCIVEMNVYHFDLFYTMIELTFKLSS